MRKLPNAPLIEIIFELRWKKIPPPIVENGIHTFHVKGNSSNDKVINLLSEDYDVHVDFKLRKAGKIKVRLKRVSKFNPSSFID